MKYKSLVLIIAMFLLFSTIAPSASNTSKLGLSQDERYKIYLEKLEEEMPRLLKKYNVPGAAVTIIRDGKIDWNKGFGLADQDLDIPVESKTIFQVASVSKSIAAWGVMKLVEEGKVELDAPVGKYLTKWQLPESEFSQEVTIRRLLGHTAGLSVDSYAGYSKIEEDLSSIEDSLAGKIDEKSKVFVAEEPERSFLYSGGGYSVLQLLVEEVSGMPFEEYMEKEILIPLGMTNSSFIFKEEIKEQIAKPYGVFGDELTNYLFIEKAAAGLYTSNDDLARFLIATMEAANGAKEGVLNQDSVATMIKSLKIKDGSETGYGLGYLVSPLSNGNNAVYHYGANRGWMSGYMGNVNNKDGIVILTNSYLGNPLINQLIAEWIEMQTGSMTNFYKNIERTYQRIKTISSILLALIVAFLVNGVVQLLKGKRTYLTKGMVKRKWLKGLQISLPLSVVLMWWLVLYMPWYKNGWVIFPFLPYGFSWVTTVVTVGGLTLSISSLFPKKVNKSFKSFFAKKTNA